MALKTLAARTAAALHWMEEHQYNMTSVMSPTRRRFHRLTCEAGVFACYTILETVEIAMKQTKAQGKR